MYNDISKGFQLTFPNGVILGFWKSLQKSKKSYDLMINNGKDNVFYKVGNITDIDKRETVIEKLEYEVFSEQCFEQAKKECDGLDCAWCGIADFPREVSNDQ